MTRSIFRAASPRTMRWFVRLVDRNSTAPPRRSPSAERFSTVRSYQALRRQHGPCREIETPWPSKELGFSCAVLQRSLEHPEAIEQLNPTNDCSAIRD